MGLEALVAELVAALELSIDRVALQLAQELLASVAIERNLYGKRDNLIVRISALDPHKSIRKALI